MILVISLLFTTFTGSYAQKRNSVTGKKKPISKTSLVTGADQTNRYLSFLKGKNVGLCINNTSVIGRTSSFDSLISLGIKVVRGFGPEHGFRGKASAGAKVSDEIDDKSGVPIISLYGNHYKPSKEEMAGIDVMIFDMQDVGVRFYTYSSTLYYIMEACAENNVELIVFDRPNPLGPYVDGPIMDNTLKSFVGLLPMPIVHGLTFGEYAEMINGEHWLENGMQCNLKVIKMLNFHHGKTYDLPIAPSPNLNTQQSIFLYPSLCLFEGTDISEGRGTYFPFTIIGSPDLKGKYSFSYTPVPIIGMSERPKHVNNVCYGLDLRKYDTREFIKTGRLNLKWVIELYNAYPDKEKFFRKGGSFDRLAGTANLRQQIIAGTSIEEIHKSWEPGLTQYKEIRKKYLMYPN